MRVKANGYFQVTESELRELVGIILDFIAKDRYVSAHQFEWVGYAPRNLLVALAGVNEPHISKVHHAAQRGLQFPSWVTHPNGNRKKQSGFRSTDRVEIDGHRVLCSDLIRSFEFNKIVRDMITAHNVDPDAFGIVTLSEEHVRVVGELIEKRKAAMRAEQATTRQRERQDKAEARELLKHEADLLAFAEDAHHGRRVAERQELATRVEYARKKEHLEWEVRAADHDQAWSQVKLTEESRDKVMAERDKIAKELVATRQRETALAAENETLKSRVDSLIRSIPTQVNDAVNAALAKQRAMFEAKNTVERIPHKGMSPGMAKLKQLQMQGDPNP